MKSALSTTQVAMMLGVTSQTIANWIDQGQLRASRTPGGHRRIDAGDLEDFLTVRGMRMPEEMTARPHSILVVEDDPQVGPWLVMQLTTARPDLRVLLAQDGFSAGELVALNQPDTVLLDIYLPGLDGFEVCRRIKGRPETAGITVIAMSANNTPDVRDTILEAGAVAFLPKPVNLSRLLCAIAEHQPIPA